MGVCIPGYQKGKNMNQQGEACRMLLEGGQGEIIEKKSRFIATVSPVTSEAQAIAFIEEMRKKYWDARHNCYAYVIGRKAELCRCSDDGEPSGTAGRPMLEVLLGDGVRNVVVVVTRYFGGTLLGTGGLVRAYTQATQEGLAASVIGVERAGYELLVTIDYNGVGKLQYLMGQRGIEPIYSEYGLDVRFTLLIPVEKSEEIHKAMVEASNGRVKWEIIKELYFIDKDC